MTPEEAYANYPKHAEEIKAFVEGDETKRIIGELTQIKTVADIIDKKDVIVMAMVGYIMQPVADPSIDLMVQQIKRIQKILTEEDFESLALTEKNKAFCGKLKQEKLYYVPEVSVQDDKVTKDIKKAVKQILSRAESTGTTKRKK